MWGSIMIVLNDLKLPLDNSNHIRKVGDVPFGIAFKHRNSYYIKIKEIKDISHNDYNCITVKTGEPEHLENNIPVEALGAAVFIPRVV